MLATLGGKTDRKVRPTETIHSGTHVEVPVIFNTKGSTKGMDHTGKDGGSITTGPKTVLSRFVSWLQPGRELGTVNFASLALRIAAAPRAVTVYKAISQLTDRWSSSCRRPLGMLEWGGAPRVSFLFSFLSCHALFDCFYCVSPFYWATRPSPCPGARVLIFYCLLFTGDTRDIFREIFPFSPRERNHLEPGACI